MRRRRRSRSRRSRSRRRRKKRKRRHAWGLRRCVCQGEEEEHWARARCSPFLS